MMPAYRYTDSYNRSQVPSMQYYHPNFEAVPPHMKIDPSKPTVMCEPWPYVTNYAYPAAPYHGCCNFPGYYGLRPPCPQFAPGHPAAPYHGCCNFPGYYGLRPPCPQFAPGHPHCCGQPVQYVPPPHYMTELPRYEYEKIAPRGYDYHCCGCPNHVHNQRNNGFVKVEEHEPEETKDDRSFVPFKGNNNGLPIAWIPLSNIEKPGKAAESETADKSSQALKSHETLELFEPKVWNGWFPVDLRNFSPSSEGGDKEKNMSAQNEQKNGAFPFPVISMPSYDKQDDNEKAESKEKDPHSKPIIKFFPVKLLGDHDELQTDSDGEMSPEAKEDTREMDPPFRSIKDPSPAIKFFPVKLPGDPDALQKDFGGEMGPKAQEKTVVKGKMVPVKDIEALKEHEYTERNEESSDGNNLQSKSSRTAAKRQSTSPPKSSKLPPICLRLDPLPKKKNGNGSSRSPSPPGSSEKRQEQSKATAKDSAFSDVETKSLQDYSLRSSNDLEEKKEEKKVQDKVDTGSNENQDESKINESLSVRVENEGLNDVVGESTREEELGATNTDGSAKPEIKVEKKNLSHKEAAIIIQSAFRAYEVRRWEPVKKLRELAKVKEKMVELRNQIHALESSSTLKDDKQRMIIGEMLMSLLLKLDTVQGLHPSLRDIRKSLARELVTLQEKLDVVTKRFEDMMAKDRFPEGPSVDPCGDDHETTATPTTISEHMDEELRKSIIMSDEEQRKSEAEHAEELSSEKNDFEAGGEPVEVTCCVPSAAELQCKRDEGNEFADMEVAEISNQMNVQAELHFGVLDEEEPKKCKTSETQEGNGRDPSLSLKETPILDESMEHSEVDESVEQSEEKELPILDEEVRVGPTKENDSSIDSNGSVLDSDVQQVEVKELDTVDENGVVSGFEGLEDVVTQLQNHGDYDVQEEIDYSVDENGVESGPQGMENVVTLLQNHGDDDVPEEIDHSLTTEGFIQIMPTQEKDEHNECQLIVQNVNEESTGPEEKYNSDQMKGPETHEDPVTGPQFAPASEELDVVASELSPISSTASNLSANEQDVRMESDWKLIEENAKLREMMEKLIEAGKEQLSVISNLTGRVKDLEKKLSKKKTTRTRRHKTAMVPGSCAKPSNESRREAFDVTM